jgi:hypothetical protein
MRSNLLQLQLRFPLSPRLSSCVCVGPHGVAAVICDGCFVAVLDVAASVGQQRVTLR